MTLDYYTSSLLSCLCLALIVYLSGESAVLNFMCFMTWFVMTAGAFSCNINSSWDILLVIIVVLTALFLVFMYIASVNPEMPPSFFSSKYSVIWISLIFLIFMFPLYIMCQIGDDLLVETCCNGGTLADVPTVEEIYPWSYPVKILCLSFSALTTLLFLVMIFVRVTYFKKKGGMRGKFPKS